MCMRSFALNGQTTHTRNVVQDTPLRSASWTTFFGQARAAQASPLRSEPRTTRDMRKFKNFSASPKISELRMSRKTLCASKKIKNRDGILG
jgi:hypothetical protein